MLQTQSLVNRFVDSYIKAKTIRVWANGDHQCHVFHIHPKNFRSWNVLINHLSQTMLPTFGAIKSLVELNTKKKITCLEDLDSRKKYIAVGATCTSIKIPTGGYKTKEEMKKKETATKVSSPKGIKVNASESFLRETGRLRHTVIYVTVSGRENVLQKAVFKYDEMKNYNLIRTYLERILRVSEGIQCFCTSSGTTLKDVSEFRHGSFYIAVPIGEKFEQMDYTRLLHEKYPFVNKVKAAPKNLRFSLSPHTVTLRVGENSMEKKKTIPKSFSESTKPNLCTFKSLAEEKNPKSKQTLLSNDHLPSTLYSQGDKRHSKHIKFTVRSSKSKQMLMRNIATTISRNNLMDQSCDPITTLGNHCNTDPRSKQFEKQMCAYYTLLQKLDKINNPESEESKTSNNKNIKNTRASSSTQVLIEKSFKKRMAKEAIFAELIKIRPKRSLELHKFLDLKNIVKSKETCRCNNDETIFNPENDNKENINVKRLNHNEELTDSKLLNETTDSNTFKEEEIHYQESCSDEKLERGVTNQNIIENQKLSSQIENSILDEKLEYNENVEEKWLTEKEEIAVESEDNENYGNQADVSKGSIREQSCNKTDYEEQKLNPQEVAENPILDEKFDYNEDIEDQWLNKKEEITVDTEGDKKYDNQTDIFKRSLNEQSCNKNSSQIVIEEQKLNQQVVTENPIFDEKVDYSENIKEQFLNKEEEVAVDSEGNKKYDNQTDVFKRSISEQSCNKNSSKVEIKEQNLDQLVATANPIFDEKLDYSENIEEQCINKKEEVAVYSEGNKKYGNETDVFKTSINEQSCNKKSSKIDIEEQNLTEQVVRANPIFDEKLDCTENVEELCLNKKEEIAVDSEGNKKYGNQTDVCKRSISEQSCNKNSSQIDIEGKNLNEQVVAANPILDEKFDCNKNVEEQGLHNTTDIFKRNISEQGCNKTSSKIDIQEQCVNNGLSKEKISIPNESDSNKQNKEEPINKIEKLEYVEQNGDFDELPLKQIISKPLHDNQSNLEIGQKVLEENIYNENKDENIYSVTNLSTTEFIENTKNFKENTSKISLEETHNPILHENIVSENDNLTYEQNNDETINKINTSKISLEETHNPVLHENIVCENDNLTYEQNNDEPINEINTSKISLEENHIPILHENIDPYKQCDQILNSENDNLTYEQNNDETINKRQLNSSEHLPSLQSESQISKNSREQIDGKPSIEQFCSQALNEMIQNIPTEKCDLQQSSSETKFKTEMEPEVTITYKDINNIENIDTHIPLERQLYYQSLGDETIYCKNNETVQVMHVQLQNKEEFDEKECHEIFNEKCLESKETLNEKEFKENYEQNNCEQTSNTTLIEENIDNSNTENENVSSNSIPNKTLASQHDLGASDENTCEQNFREQTPDNEITWTQCVTEIQMTFDGNVDVQIVQYTTDDDQTDTEEDKNINREHLDNHVSFTQMESQDEENEQAIEEDNNATDGKTLDKYLTSEEIICSQEDIIGDSQISQNLNDEFTSNETISREDVDDISMQKYLTIDQIIYDEEANGKSSEVSSDISSYEKEGLS